ncbi:hypothetical protein E2C01_090749 [Portunus trituberculatus]|uniref:Uncharacterized protein n=1 Tax=Portunus trituberculatus TaxID=210409 RepID=A0A5B7JM67_PORTR|nr:hypothetical protein [Portunus trituberculatus]
MMPVSLPPLTQPRHKGKEDRRKPAAAVIDSPSVRSGDAHSLAGRAVLSCADLYRLTLHLMTAYALTESPPTSAFCNELKTGIKM